MVLVSWLGAVSDGSVQIVCGVASSQDLDLIGQQNPKMKICHVTTTNKSGYLHCFNFDTYT